MCCFVLMKSVDNVKNKILSRQTETIRAVLICLYQVIIKINCVDAVLKGMSTYKVTVQVMLAAQV